MGFGHFDVNELPVILTPKPNAVELVCRAPTEALVPQSSSPCPCYRLDKGVDGVGSDWRHCNAVHRHATALRGSDPPTILQRG